MPRLLLASILLALGACAAVPPQGRTPLVPSPDMLAVLQERREMRARELAGVSIERAREVPPLSAAARAIPNVVGLPAPSTEVPRMSQLTASGAEGPLPARLYRPAATRNTPAILYFPGGTWATGNPEDYAESARQLAARTGWVVVMLRTRLAPEARFPAAHDDALALYQWARAHLREWGADPTRVVLAGEGPGANLALSTALAARDRGIATPDHLLLITPLVSTRLDGPSMGDSGRARPLSRRTVRWAQRLYAPDDLRDPRIDLLGRPDLAGLPPTTVVLAEIDPLRSEGEVLAGQLAAAGVPADVRLFPGTTHDFFGLGLQVREAAAAEAYVAARLKAHLDRPAQTVRSVRVRRAAPPRVLIK